MRQMGYILRANRKAREGINHPARDAQFGCINDRVKEAVAVTEPAISVNSKFCRVNLNKIPGFPDSSDRQTAPRLCLADPALTKSGQRLPAWSFVEGL